MPAALRRGSANGGLRQQALPEGPSMFIGSGGEPSPTASLTRGSLGGLRQRASPEPPSKMRQQALPEKQSMFLGSGGEPPGRMNMAVNVEEFLFQGQTAQQGRRLPGAGPIPIKRQHHGDRDPRELMTRVRDDLGVGLIMSKDATASSKPRQKGGSLVVARRSAAGLPQVASPDRSGVGFAPGMAMLGSASMPDLTGTSRQAPPLGLRARGPPTRVRGPPDPQNTPERRQRSGPLNIENAGTSPFEAAAIDLVGSGLPSMPPKQAARGVSLAAHRRQTEAANAAFGLGRHVMQHASTHPDEQGPAIVVKPFG